MAIATVDMKHGMRVKTHSGEWEVLDRHPNNRTWWLHRWNDAGEWETDYAHEGEMEVLDVETLAEPIQESAKWTKAPFNTANSKTGKERKTGYVLGKWGAHQVGSFAHERRWVITHLPSGLSVKDRPTVAEARALIEQLAAMELPLLARLEFGCKPTAIESADTAKLLEFLQGVA